MAKHTLVDMLDITKHELHEITTKNSMRDGWLIFIEKLDILLDKTIGDINKIDKHHDMYMYRKKAKEHFLHNLMESKKNEQSN